MKRANLKTFNAETVLKDMNDLNDSMSWGCSFISGFEERQQKRIVIGVHWMRFWFCLPVR